ncbi:unnamed protein product [Ambrosiozyma monospora]|uniref:Unnamed protein product n=1 Tax=Ambrosiozyma monospora TaxID=43982 RepID=A0ACB5T6A7_AMBMO|nr:unnamed protein product [Ambrosiozyma monospora]
MFHMEHEEGSRLFNYVDIDAMADQTHSRPIYARVIENFKDRPEWIDNEKKQKENEQNAASKKSSWKFWAKGNDNDKTVAPAVESKKPAEGEYDDAVEFSPLQFMNAGVPLGLPAKLDYTNNHMQYLVTWFGLSIASLMLLIISIKKNKVMNPNKEKLRHANAIFK